MSSTPNPASTPARSAQTPDRGIVSSGWLAADSTFSRREERRLGAAFVSSLLLHAGMFAAIVLALSYQPPSRELPPPQRAELDLVFVQPQPGPGGGGGGSPAPAPPRPIEIPETTPPDPVPIEVEPEVEPPPPIPVLDAPIRTSAATVLRASGRNAVALADVGGLSRGRGLGEGTGDGVGPGDDGGFGGGIRQPGNGIEGPRLLREVRPTYTSEGMRAKVQGEVELDAIVLESGRVGEVRVHKSLDRQFGLDEAAMAAARDWRFTPCTQQGDPVPCQIRMVLEFRIH